MMRSAECRGYDGCMTHKAPALHASRTLAQRRWRGVSLIELAMYLGIAGIITMGILVYYTSASRAQRMQDSANMVVMIRSAVADIYAGQRNYAGLTTAVLVGSPLIPKKWKRASVLDQLITLMGAPMTVEESAIDAGYLSITFRDITEGACNALINFGWENLVEMRTSVATLVLPPSVAGARAACVGGVSSLNMTFR